MTTSNSIKHLDESSFESEISSGVTLVDFFAEWCAPCRMLTPVLEEIAAEYGEKASIAKLDIDNAQQVTAQFQVTSVPTMIIFKDGQEVNRVIGIKDGDSIKDMLNAALS